ARARLELLLGGAERPEPSRDDPPQARREPLSPPAHRSRSPGSARLVLSQRAHCSPRRIVTTAAPGDPPHAMEPLSATLITCNEEANIEEALRRLAWVDEIVVVDSGSSDRTVEISRRYTDRVHHREWTGYVDQKNYALEKASHDWILSLDADERPSPELE